MAIMSTKYHFNCTFFDSEASIIAFLDLIELDEKDVETKEKCLRLYLGWSSNFKVVRIE